MMDEGALAVTGCQVWRQHQRDSRKKRHYQQKKLAVGAEIDRVKEKPTHTLGKQ